MSNKSKNRPLTKVTVLEISDAFTKVLHEWLSLVQLREVRKRNLLPAYRDINACATHDFCDANMAMEEAFRRVTGKTTGQLSRRDRTKEGCDRNCTCMSDHCLWMWTEAWDMAQKKGFKL